MKLIDEKLVEKYAIETGSNEVPRTTDHYSHGLKVGIEFGIEKGVYFAEQQLKQKMIEFAEWCCWNGWTKILETNNSNWKHITGNITTTEQLLEEFINQQK